MCTYSYLYECLQSVKYTNELNAREEFNGGSVHFDFDLPTIYIYTKSNNKKWEREAARERVRMRERKKVDHIA